MKEQPAGLIGPDSPPGPNSDLPLLDQARAIEKDMFQVMTTQVKLAIVQVILALIGIVTALIIAALH